MAARLAPSTTVEVVNLLGRKSQTVDDVAVLFVVVVAQAAGDVAMRTLAQVLDQVLGLLAPQRPLNRSGPLFALISAAASDVADCGQHALGDLALATVDEFELDRASEVRVMLDDLKVCRDLSKSEIDQPGPDLDSLTTDPLARTPSLQAGAMRPIE